MFKLLPTDWDLSARGRKIRDRVLVFVIFPLVLAMGAWVLFGEMTSRGQQRVLLSEIQQTDSSVLESAVIIPGHDPYIVEPCLVLVDRALLQEFASFLAEADKIGYGGHQRSRFKFTVRLVFSDERMKSYLVRAFESHPSDMFLDRDLHEKYGEGSFRRKGQRAVRVPGLLPWLRERAVRAGCPVE